MKLHYRYRFYYAIFLYALILLVGVAYFIYPIRENLLVLSEKETTLKRMLLTFKSSQQKEANLVLRNPTEHVADLLRELAWHGVKVASIKMNTQKTQNSYHLKLLGTYQAFNAFFQAFDAKHQAWWIGNFLLEAKEKLEMSLEADFLLSQTRLALQLSSVISSSSSSPFCQGNALILSQDQTEIIRSTSIKQMKMLGYLEKEKERIAFLALSDTAVISVKQGMQIGSEEARIIRIDPRSVQLQLPNQDTLALSLF